MLSSPTGSSAAALSPQKEKHFSVAPGSLWKLTLCEQQELRFPVCSQASWAPFCFSCREVPARLSPRKSGSGIRSSKHLITQWVLLATSTHPCVSLCSAVSHSYDHMDCSPPGFSVHGIFQARMLEWVALFSSRESS